MTRARAGTSVRTARAVELNPKFGVWCQSATCDGLRSKGDEQRLTSEGWGATIGVVGTVETKILISEFASAAATLGLGLGGGARSESKILIWEFGRGTLNLKLIN